jgi:hypothetical protein
MKPFPTFRHVITEMLLIDAGICGLVWAALKFTN